MEESSRVDMGGIRKFGETTDGCSKMQTYRGMLLDSARNLRNFLGVGGLTAEDRPHLKNTCLPHYLHYHFEVK